MTDRRLPAGLDRLRARREERRNRRALELARMPRAARTPDRAEGGGADARPNRTGRQKLVLSALVTAVVLVGLLFVGPFPVRAWWAQRARTHALQHQIDVVEQANDRLEARAKHLEDPATVARLARQNYGMVREGERSYALLPPPKVPVTLPPVWPFVTVAPASPPATAPAAAGN
jgi:cell division protein FtsB